MIPFFKSLQTRADLWIRELRYKQRLFKCRRALARSIAAMEREADTEDCVIWEEKK